MRHDTGEPGPVVFATCERRSDIEQVGIIGLDARAMSVGIDFDQHRQMQGVLSTVGAHVRCGFDVIEHDRHTRTAPHESLDVRQFRRGDAHGV